MVSGAKNVAEEAAVNTSCALCSIPKIKDLKSRISHLIDQEENKGVTTAFLRHIFISRCFYVAAKAMLIFSTFTDVHVFTVT